MTAKYPICPHGTSSVNWGDDSTWFLVSNDAATTKPTASDAISFKATSFPDAGQSLIVNVTSVCADLNWTNATNNPTFLVNANLTYSGDLTFIAAMSMAGSDTTKSLLSSGMNRVLTTHGLNLVVRVVLTNASSQSLSFADAVTCYRVVVPRGTLTTNNNTINCVSEFQDGSGAGSKSLVLGTSAITCTSWGFSASVTGFTLSHAGSITCAANFLGGTPTGSYNNINLSANSNVTGTFTCVTLTRNGRALGGEYMTLPAGVIVTSTTFAPIAGGKGYPLTVKSSTPGTPATITTTNWTGVTGPLTIKDITATNAVDLSGIESYDAGGNTGITFKYPHLPVTPVMKTMRRLIASGVIN